MGLKKSYKRRKRRGQSGSHRLKTGRTGSVHSKRQHGLLHEIKKRRKPMKRRKHNQKAVNEMIAYVLGRVRFEKAAPEMFDSVQQAFNAAKKR